MSCVTTGLPNLLARSSSAPSANWSAPSSCAVNTSTCRNRNCAAIAWSIWTSKNSEVAIGLWPSDHALGLQLLPGQRARIGIETFLQLVEFTLDFRVDFI